MKKVRLFLIAAIIMGAATAFNQPSTADEYVQTESGFVLKSVAQATIGDCQSASNVCTYTLKPGHQPNTADDFTTNPAENAVFMPY